MRVVFVALTLVSGFAAARPLEVTSRALVYRGEEGDLSFGRAEKGAIVLQYPEDIYTDPKTWLEHPSLPFEGRVRVIWPRVGERVIGWIEAQALKDAVRGARVNQLKRWYVMYLELLDTLLPPGRSSDGVAAARAGYNIFNASLQYVMAALKTSGGDDLPDLLMRNCAETRVAYFAERGETMPEDERLAFCDFSKASKRSGKTGGDEVPVPAWLKKK